MFEQICLNINMNMYIYISIHIRCRNATGTSLSLSLSNIHTHVCIYIVIIYIIYTYHRLCSRNTSASKDLSLSPRSSSQPLRVSPGASGHRLQSTFGGALSGQTGAAGQKLPLCWGPNLWGPDRDPGILVVPMPIGSMVLVYMLTFGVYGG
jgi:hypothetical protein